MLKLLFFLHDDESIFNSLSEFKDIEGVLQEDNVDVLQEDNVDVLQEDNVDVLQEDNVDELQDGFELLDDLELQLEREQLPN
jgi:hypothetical protein